MSKKKKEKVIYYDDNSTISDMSEVTGIGRKNQPREPKQKSTFKEKWKTYWAAVKMMVGPMLIVLIILAVLYLLILWFTGGFG